MSLKAFHIFFVVISTILSFGFGVWAVMQQGGFFMAMGVFSLVSGVGLVVYGVKFLEKFRNVSYL